MIMATRLLNQDGWEVNHHPCGQSHIYSRTTGYTYPMKEDPETKLPTIKFRLGNIESVADDGYDLDANVNISVVRVKVDGEVEAVDNFEDGEDSRCYL